MYGPNLVKLGAVVAKVYLEQKISAKLNADIATDPEFSAAYLFSTR